MSRDVEILGHSVVFDGFFRMERYHLRHTLFSGGLSDELVRELFRRGRVAAVLPYDPVHDAVVLVEQFRIGAMEDEAGAWLLEPVAGYAEPGEAVEQVARREADEEAGLHLQTLHRICDYYPSPGASSEQVSLFCGQVDTAKAGGVHGLAGEGEDIRSHVLPCDQALERVNTGGITSAMTIIALQWLALNRTYLQAQWRAD